MTATRQPRQRAKRPRPVPLQLLIDATGETDHRRISDALDVTHRRQLTHIRKRHGGMLTIEQADRMACALGKHLGEIWPEYWTLDDPTHGV